MVRAPAIVGQPLDQQLLGAVEIPLLDPGQLGIAPDHVETVHQQMFGHRDIPD